MTRRSANATHPCEDERQAEWQATYSELVEILSSIEDCLGDLEVPPRREPLLRVFDPDTSVCCL